MRLGHIPFSRASRLLGKRYMDCRTALSRVSNGIFEKGISMKSYRFALMFVACAAAYPAFSQNSLPQCESSNYDAARGIYTIMNAAPDVATQQCLITVNPATAPVAQSSTRLNEGT